MEDFIKQKRPTLSDSSIKTYTSVLRSLHKKVFGDVINVDNFKKKPEIMAYLEPLPFSKRRTVLSALVVITDDADYRDLMMADAESMNTELKQQHKTEEQSKNWVSAEEIEGRYKALREMAEHLYKKKDHTEKDLQDIQQYIILCLLGGKYIVPRRSKDYCDFKIANITAKDNRMDKNQFVFVSYKTAKTYGKQVLDIPKELKSILKKWIKINPTDWLLFDMNLEPLTSIKLNQRLNKIFGKKTGVNLLRHSYLTDRFADHTEKQKEAEQTMTDMGSSINQLQLYVKTD
jgi:hypothetical protein